MIHSQLEAYSYSIFRMSLTDAASGQVRRTLCLVALPALIGIGFASFLDHGYGEFSEATA